MTAEAKCKRPEAIRANAKLLNLADVDLMGLRVSEIKALAFALADAGEPGSGTFMNECEHVALCCLIARLAQEIDEVLRRAQACPPAVIEAAA